jgi:hypothetical protein
MSILSQVIDQLPRIAKYLFFLILALNAHSLPLVWHFRFWWVSYLPYLSRVEARKLTKVATRTKVLVSQDERPTGVYRPSRKEDTNYWRRKIQDNIKKESMDR